MQNKWNMEVVEFGESILLHFHFSRNMVGFMPFWALLREASACFHFGSSFEWRLQTVWGVFFLSEFGKFLSGYVKNKSGIVEREKSKCFMKLPSFNHKQGPNFCNYWGRKSALLAWFCCNCKSDELMQCTLRFLALFLLKRGKIICNLPICHPTQKSFKCKWHSCYSTRSLLGKWLCV